MVPKMPNENFLKTTLYDFGFEGKPAWAGNKMRVAGDQYKTTSSNRRFRRFSLGATGRTHGYTDGRMDPLIEMRGRI